MPPELLTQGVGGFYTDWWSYGMLLSCILSTLLSCTLLSCGALVVLRYPHPHPRRDGPRAVNREGAMDITRRQKLNQA